MSDPVAQVDKLPELADRDRAGHKGSYGRVLVVAGSAGMIGAAALAANACLRAGAGLVTVAIPAPIQQTVAGLCPCATSLGLSCDTAGRLAPEAIGQMHRHAETVDVLAVGPGLGRSAAARNLVRAVLEIPLPLVLDADGLTALTKIDDWPGLRNGPMVLTPHPGEFSRLTGREIAEIQSDRSGAAVEAAGRWNAGLDEPDRVVLLKGAGTVVTDSRRAYTNRTGNPGMASGGAGDVLTGVIAALLGQGLTAFDAACLGSWVHGRAGDLAAERHGEISVMATDLIDQLGQAFQQRP